MNLRNAENSKPSGVATFSLDPTPPFRLDLTAWALRRRPDNEIDRWDGSTYERALVIDGRAVEIAAEQHDSEGTPELRVIATVDGPMPKDAEAVVRAVLEKTLGLNVNLSGFYLMAECDARLSEMARRFRGIKPPRFPTMFEALINGIACQQVTLTLGIRMLDKLSQAYGTRSAGKQEAVTFAFPTPEALAACRPEYLRALGFSGQKARAMLELAQAIADRRIDLEEIETLDNDAAVERLCRLRGVGRWTAEYVLLRGLGKLEVFPGDDVGARNNLRRWLGVSEPLDYDGVRRAVEPFQPYAGFVYFHLLLNNPSSAGYLPHNTETE